MLDLTRELDEYCLNIVRVLLLGFKKFRFNDLYRTLNSKIGFKLSKPTFSDHLKHLLDKELVIRKVEGIQKVTYIFNYQKFKDLADAVKNQESTDELDVQQKKFNSLSLEEQIQQIVYSTIAISLTSLRLEILNTLEPSRQLIRNLQLMVNSRAHHIYEKWLLENCSANKEYGQKALEKTTYFRDRFSGKRTKDHKKLEIPDSAITF